MVESNMLERESGFPQRCLDGEVLPKKGIVDASNSELAPFKHVLYVMKETPRKVPAPSTCTDALPPNQAQPTHSTFEVRPHSFRYLWTT